MASLVSICLLEFVRLFIVQSIQMGGAHNTIDGMAAV